MDESILNTIKEMLGASPDYDAFNTDIIIHINTAFMELTQIGVGPQEGFMITDDSETWADFIPETDALQLQGIKSYVYLSVKLVFDPPSNSSATESINRQLAKLEWRLNHVVDAGKEKIQNG